MSWKELAVRASRLGRRHLWGRIMTVWGSAGEPPPTPTMRKGAYIYMSVGAHSSTNDFALEAHTRKRGKRCTEIRGSAHTSCASLKGALEVSLRAGCGLGKVCPG